MDCGEWMKLLVPPLIGATATTIAVVVTWRLATRSIQATMDAATHSVQLATHSARLEVIRDRYIKLINALLDFAHVRTLLEARVEHHNRTQPNYREDPRRSAQDAATEIQSLSSQIIAVWNELLISDGDDKWVAWLQSKRHFVFKTRPQVHLNPVSGDLDENHEPKWDETIRVIIELQKMTAQRFRFRDLDSKIQKAVDKKHGSAAEQTGAQIS